MRDATGGTPPTTVQGDLAKLPLALGPLQALPQWCVWRWVQNAKGVWQKPPFQSLNPDWHASVTEPDSWTDYATALATVQARKATGITFILSADTPLAAADVDHCRDRHRGSLDDWAQSLLDQADHTYVEITPSGTGIRIWGAAAGESLSRNVRLLDGAGIEFYRRTAKALTVTGLQLGTSAALGDIDQLLDRTLIWAERHKGKPPQPQSSCAGSTLRTYSIEDFELAVRDGPPDGANRSDLFHSIVGHYLGVGWTSDQIFQHLQQHPDGLGARYLAEGRLRQEIGRSLDKWAALRKAQQQFPTSTWSNDWLEPSPAPEPTPQPAPATVPESDDLGDAADDEVDELDDDELEEPSPPSRPLPPLHCHGDPDPRPLTSWLMKNLLPAVSYGFLSGQWGSGKTFMVFELAACLMTGQPFIGHRIKRQCGVLLIAAEGAGEVRKRLNATVQEKCGGMQRAPFRWFESAPTLLGPDAAETLIAMAKQADTSLQQEFGLPLGLIVIDTVAASAGYAQQGAESDAAVVGAIMRVLAQTAMACNCVILGVDHFGKTIESGTRGSSAKEANSELVLACLGERELSGRVVNMRLAVRKNRAGPQGMEYPFTLREVELGFDEDGDPITTMVVDWTNAGDSATRGPGADAWAESRQADTRQAMLLLKRVMMAMLAEKGVDLPSAPDGPVVRMIDRELVRDEFYARTAADGTLEQKQDQRRKRFRRALDRAEEKQLIGVREINGTVYLWLTQAQPDEDF